MNFRSILVVTLSVISTTVYGQTYHYESVKGDPLHTRIYTLPNGLKVFLSVNKEKPRIQANIAVRTGSRNDPAETTGLAHYLEHLMFKGTTHFGTSNLKAEAPLLDSIQNRFEAYRHITDPAARKKAYHEIDSISQLAAKYNIPNEYDKLMASIGSQGSNAYTSNDVTCYVENIPSNEIDAWAKVQSDRFRNMVIRGFHTELEAVYEEFNIGLNSDMRKSWAALNKKMFPNHPYGTQTTIGTQEHLKNPSIVNIKNYFNRYYVPNNIAICMAGDFDPDNVIRIIDKYFGDWKKSLTLSRPEYAPVADLKAPVDTTVVGQEAAYVVLGWKAKGASSMQADTLEVISEMLRNSKAGLMDVNLIFPMKLQGAYAYYEGLHDYGQFVLQGIPKQGQSLNDVKALLLEQIELLKRGEFPATLLPSVINNMKLNLYQSYQSNNNRVSLFVNAFINDQAWEDVVKAMERRSKMTKEEIVAFARKFFADNYVAVYKKVGTDSSVQKIDKPKITPIPTNNDKQSAFLKAVTSEKPTPIKPHFLDFNKDLVTYQVNKNTDIIYKHNDEDQLFTLKLDFPIGSATDNKLSIAADIIDYAGTPTMSSKEIKEKLYELACDYTVSVGAYHTSLTLTGLNDNMPQAIRLLAGLMDKATISDENYRNVVDLIVKGRNDQKKSQKDNFNALRNYGLYGKFNPTLNKMTEQEMKATNGETLLANLRNVRHLYPMTIMYYGPSTDKAVTRLVMKDYPRKKVKGAQAMMTKHYKTQQTPNNEILLAPYEAKNIYLMQYNNDGKQWTPNDAPIDALFNTYFGKGMNSIVFQELREARALAYSAGAYYVEPYRKGNSEYFYTFIITQSDKMMDCVAEFNNLLNHIPQQPTSFELAKQRLDKELASKRTTRFAVLEAYMNARELGINYDINKKIYDTLPSLTLPDLIKFAQERIANKPYKYLILGDEKNLDVKGLQQIAPIHKLSTEEIFGY